MTQYITYGLAGLCVLLFAGLGAQQWQIRGLSRDLALSEVTNGTLTGQIEQMREARAVSDANQKRLDIELGKMEKFRDEILKGEVGDEISGGATQRVLDWLRARAGAGPGGVGDTGGPDNP